MRTTSKFMIFLGISIILCVLFLVIFAPLFTKYSPIETNSKNVLSAPSKEHILGTDHFGRDIFSRLLYGGRITLPTSFLVLFFTAIIGVVLGLISALNYNSIIDIIIMRLVDIIISIPFIVLAMAISAIFGRGLDKVLLVVIFVWWAPFTRYTRSLILSLKNKQAILAAKMLGDSDITIIRREILPNIYASLFIYLTFEFSSLILSLATLSFFGLASQPPTPEWGSMLADGRNYFIQSVHPLLWPIVAIVLVVLGLNLLGEGLRDYFYPYDIIFNQEYSNEK